MRRDVPFAIRERVESWAHSLVKKLGMYFALKIGERHTQIRVQGPCSNHTNKSF